MNVNMNLRKMKKCAQDKKIREGLIKLDSFTNKITELSDKDSPNFCILLFANSYSN